MKQKISGSNNSQNESAATVPTIRVLLSAMQLLSKLKFKELCEEKGMTTLQNAKTSFDEDLLQKQEACKRINQPQDCGCRMQSLQVDPRRRS